MKPDYIELSKFRECFDATDAAYSESNVNMKCRRRIIGYLFVLSFILVCLFILGYMIDPLILRIGWLVITGTLFFLSGISLYLVITGVINCDGKCKETI